MYYLNLITGKEGISFNERVPRCCKYALDDYEKRVNPADRRKTGMINIAICDDDTALTGIVEQLIQKLASEYGTDIRCEVFFDGASLLKAVTEQRMCFDLVYLDIEMADMDGICTAQVLRDMGLPVLIVYLSGHEEYLKELFCTEPFRFLSKPVDEAAFREVFLSACGRIRSRVGYFTFSYNKVLHRIPFHQISYFESNGRVISIHMSGKGNEKTGSRQDRFYGKMNDVEKQVSSMNAPFLRIHQSYLVNFDYIKTLSLAEVMMMDGRMLQISEDRRKDIRTRFCALLGEEAHVNG